MAKYQGAFPTIKTHYTHADVVADMKAWAKKISGEKYHYVTWKSDDSATHTCPVCKGRKYNNHFGWNCIGFAFAIWHHGGHLASKCNCHVISNENGEKILKAKTDAEALKLAQKYIGIKDITVIRNSGKAIPKSKAKAGDIALLFDGKTYKHTYFIMSDKYVADSTGSGSDANNIRADRKFDGRYVSGMKVIFRYTGNGTTYRNYIKKNDSGDEVKKLQEFLNWALGTNLTVDGIFGEKTESTVKQFQKKYGLATDGLFGEASLKIAQNLDNGKAVSTVQPATQPVVAEKKTYDGSIPSIVLVKSNAEVIEDTIRWAKWIASDNDFHYGYTSKDKKINAHHNGCYFCGTNKKLKSKKIKDREHTYCCNPFVNAAWAHGGCVPKALDLCQKCSSWDFKKGHGYDKSKLFTNLGHPAKSKLKAGDVLCRDTHVALYIGNGKIVQASGGDDNKKNSTIWKKSISVATLTDSNYKKFPRVHRFNSSVNTITPIRHGEISKRVQQLQKFLNWYNGKEVVANDGIFGEHTWKYVKAFQTAQHITADGIVGEQTIAKMKAATK